MRVRSGASFTVPGQRELLGLACTHVEPVEDPGMAGNVLLHPAAHAALVELRRAAKAQGFDLRVASGFRDFRRQLTIWNEKARGARALLDDTEMPVDALALDPHSRVLAILRWSALPGTSRHHWGSDLDIYDAAALRPGCSPALRMDECVGRGVFAPMHSWLDVQLAAGSAFGFFRPYTGVGCDVAREPWHLSFAPLAAHCQAAFDPDALLDAWREEGLELRFVVESILGDILERYVRLPAGAYPEGCRGPLEGAG